jgi:hypothetical protein
LFVTNYVKERICRKIEIMRAIVKVNKESHYAKYNGLTFYVKEVLNQQVALLIPSIELERDVVTDFGFKEVIIVDINNELQIAYDNINWGCDKYTFSNLKTYCVANNIKYKQPEYNCYD